MSRYARPTTDSLGRQSNWQATGLGELKTSDCYPGEVSNRVKQAKIPLTCCLLGDCLSPFGGALDNLATYVLSNHPGAIATTPCHTGNLGTIHVISIQNKEYRITKGKIYTK